MTIAKLRIFKLIIAHVPCAFYTIFPISVVFSKRVPFGTFDESFEAIA